MICRWVFFCNFIILLRFVHLFCHRIKTLCSIWYMFSLRKNPKKNNTHELKLKCTRLCAGSKLGGWQMLHLLYPVWTALTWTWTQFANEDGFGLFALAFPQRVVAGFAHHLPLLDAFVTGHWTLPNHRHTHTHKRGQKTHPWVLGRHVNSLIGHNICKMCPRVKSDMISISFLGEEFRKTDSASLNLLHCVWMHRAQHWGREASRGSEAFDDISLCFIHLIVYR